MEYLDFCQKVGVKIKYYRQLQKLNQDDLAETLGVDAHYISDIECGRRNITFKTFYKIVKSLNIEPYRFFQFE